MKDFKKSGINKWRVRSGPMASDDSTGNAGAFMVPLHGNSIAMIVACDAVPVRESWWKKAVGKALRHRGTKAQSSEPGTREWLLEQSLGWEHVSVHIRYKNKKGKGILRTPTWGEMCQVKGLFWGDEETVVEFHPPKSKQVNVHDHCLHLWKLRGRGFPMPPKEMV